ncbi:centriole, cilia and spindle-associated protein [Phycodurus eques]|uniref:centriole, cilia and spindle-associated protein n=1 Tax=Phycodurus eques TaxID=693459 RepID=UPI002ACD2532|nr:centriole, cilia and spindle-associated protein [Phycodurus eques]XP_061522879.1 centriole, cilia and spindle-associated protein [Phycodurus eques]
MVTKRIRSEYMKKFKDPKWETYAKCYEEMLKYRLARRLLEQSHNPWFWSGSDSDSDSVGGNSPQASRSQAQCCGKGDDPAGTQLEECQAAEADVPRLPVMEKDEHDRHAQGVRESCAPEKERGQQSDSKHKSVAHREPQTVSKPEPEQEPAGSQMQQTKPQRLSRFTCGRRVKPALARPPTEDSNHPFALYASGEKDADIAGRKTHNVRPAASTDQIHASALRAKSRREAERQVQTQRYGRRRTKSADIDKARKTVQPEFNPWLTEYMRCFSARSR